MRSHWCISAALFLRECLVCAAAERRETKRREERLLEAAREGYISTLSELVSDPASCHPTP